MQHILQGADTVKFIKLPMLMWYEHTERVNSEGITEHIATAGMEGTREECHGKMDC